MRFCFRFRFRFRLLFRCLLLACLGLATSATRADPGYYVVTAYDDAGQRSLDLRYWTFKPQGGREAIWPELGVRFGVNSRWTTGLLVSWIGPSSLPVQQSAWLWANDVLLTQGELPWDVAVHSLVTRNRMLPGAGSVEIGPVLQTDIGRTQLNTNLFFERRFGTGTAAPLQLKYQWQVRHRWTRGLQFGVQGFGELGTWNDMAPARQQSHRAGPAVFGQLQPDAQHKVSLQAAWLLGKTNATRGHMFSGQMGINF